MSTNRLLTTKFTLGSLTLFTKNKTFQKASAREPDKFDLIADHLIKKFPERYSPSNSFKEEFIQEMKENDHPEEKIIQEDLLLDILQVLDVPYENVKRFFSEALISTTDTATQSTKSIETFAQISESANKSNINLIPETMSPEELKQKYPEACQVIFNAGKRAGMEAQQGKLPEPGTDPELDVFNAEVDKQLN